MSVIQNNLLMTPEGYQISRSVRLRSSANGYLNRTAGAPTSNLKYTVSLWMKRGKLGAQQAIIGSYNGVSDYSICYFDANDKLNFIGDSATAGRTFGLTTNAAFRDPSAWYHLIFVFDSANATVANRCIMYVNGVAQTVTGTTVPLNAPTYFNTNGIVGYLGQNGISASYNDCYLTEVNFIDGQALTPSSFGETDAVTGVWKPKKYAGTYGTNGFYLNFSDPSAATVAAIGKDNSGNGNNWTPNNISVTSGVTYDSMLDTPTPYADGDNGRGNYAVMNPLDQAGGLVFADGNLKVTAATGWDGSRATFSLPSTGKYYWEATCISRSTGATVGLLSTTAVITGDLGAASTGYVYNSGDGNKYNNSSSSAYGATWGTNAVIGIAWDADTGTLSFYKDGASQGTAWTGLSGTFSPAIGVNGSDSMAANFGQRPFAYTPPTGFKALNTQNLPDSTIKKGNAYFDATTYTGNATARTISNSGSFQPDFVWIKNRTSGSFWHQLYDALRGALKGLFSNDTSAESTYTDTLTAFASTGFTLGTDATFNGGVNKSGDSYVAWQWKESASAGFDIVTYTGTGVGVAQNVSHNLGVSPAMMIVKNRNSTQYWIVQHQKLTSIAYNMYLQTTDSQQNDSQFTGKSSTNVTVYGGSANASGSTYVMYLFAEVAGFSKFGSYTGNGSTDGPFVYCGFRPKFVLVKRTDSGASWYIHDAARDTYNQTTNSIYANLSAAEDQGYLNLDLLSNGFKLRTTTSNNASGGTYIYAAFAENPFKNSLAR